MLLAVTKSRETDSAHDITLTNRGNLRKLANEVTKKTRWSLNLLK